jgi:tetratricopeptide (TPR) repeat protein
MKDGGPQAHGRVTLAILLLLGIMLIFSPSAVFGEIKTVTHTVRQPFGGSQSPDDARIAAVARAKREALEMAGTYVQALTVVKDSRVEKDEILALSAGVLTAEVVSQENYATPDAFGVEVTVRINVDTSLLEDGVKKLLADRTRLEQLNQARKKEKELLDTVAKLEDENKRLMAEKKSTKELKEQFRAASQGLMAIDQAIRWFYKAVALWQNGKYSDPKKAIEYLNEAIRLEPDYATEAYHNRGVAYADLKDYSRAIQDYDQALRLKPDFADAYTGRGIAYNKLGQHQRAIEDFDQALRLKPDDALAYHNRGDAYLDLKNYSRAIQDYSRAIRLKPDDASAFYNRGVAYAELRDYSRAIHDYDQALRLKPDHELAYNNRGAEYHKLGQHQRAIEDFDQALRLNPESAVAYYNRGNAYLILGNRVRGCSDVQKACELGLCKAYEREKQRGDCR